MTELSTRQLDAEREMAKLGAARYAARLASTRKARREAFTGPANYLLREAVPEATTAYRLWMNGMARRPSGRRPRAYHVLHGLDRNAVVLTSLRVLIDQAMAGATWRRAVGEVGRAIEAEARARWLRRHHPGAWLRRKEQSKRVRRKRIRLMAGVKRDAEGLGWAAWSSPDRLTAGAGVVSVLMHSTGLFEARSDYRSRTSRPAVLRVKPSVASWLESTHAEAQWAQPLYLPLEVLPAEWGPDKLGGYGTDLLRQVSLVRTSSRRVRRRAAESNMPAVYSAVNLVQDTAWQVNPDVLEVASHLWDVGREAPGLGQAEPLPIPPFDKDAGREAFRARAIALKAEASRITNREAAGRALWCARRFREAKALYYPHRLDFRGRIYPMPWGLQPQGNDLVRGTMRFRDGCLLELDTLDTPAGRAFLSHGASRFGVDKVSHADRAEWVMQRADALVAIREDPLEARWWEDADEPWQFLAWALEAGELLAEGKVYSRTPCQVDASCSGLQIISLLLRDPFGGAHTNCTDGPAPRDIYAVVAARARELLTAAGGVGALWARWLGDEIPRAAVKRAVMTLPYGCTRWSVRRYFIEWFEDEVSGGRTSPWPVTSCWKEANVVADAIWDSVSELLAPALRLRTWLETVSDTVLEKSRWLEWTSPSGFRVSQDYSKYRTHAVRTSYGDKVRNVRFRRNGHDPDYRLNRQAVTANYVHSVDAAILAMALDRCRRSGVSSVMAIHDCVGFLAKDAAVVGRAIRETYADVFSRPLLATFASEAAPEGVTLPEPPPQGDLDPRAVLDSTYLFH